MAKVHFGSKTYDLPGNRVVRITIGILLVLFGLVGFLPILGFWMVPLGFIILAADIPAVRRFNKRVKTAVSRWWPWGKERRAQ